MSRFIKATFWTVLFLLMLLAIDQFLVQVPPVHPAHEAVSDFYRDFRGRLIDLVFGERRAPESIEAVIEQKQKKQAPAGRTAAKLVEQGASKQAPPAEKSASEKSPRYLYADGRGELHFVDSLDEVPDEYRAQAQPLGK